MAQITPQGKLEWVPLTSELGVEPRCLELLRTVSMMRKAYFHDHLPRLVHSIMQLVERRGLMYEGIYRVSGYD